MRLDTAFLGMVLALHNSFSVVSIKLKQGAQTGQMSRICHFDCRVKTAEVVFP
jgi:hypothetical protein